jgi:hypothetical protein
MLVSGCLEVDGNISLGAEFVVAAKGPNDLDGLCKMMKQCIQSLASS